MPEQDTIPCTDVEDTTLRLQLRHYKVLGSAETPGMPGFCTLRYESQAQEAAPAMAMLREAAPVPAAPAPAAPTIQGALEPLQKQAAEAIVNIFETGAVLGKYGQVTMIKNDNGRLTFGRSQATIESGNLSRLISNYCNAAGARFSGRLRPYLPGLKDRLEKLDYDSQLHNLLRATADDPVMRQVQDKFFEEGYWQPAVAHAAEMQIRSALGIAVVYDSHVQGSWGLIRDRTVHQHGPISATLSEQDWIKAYIKNRAEWLTSDPQSVLRKTVYRMDAFQAMVDHDKWSLELPLLVRGQEISLTTLLGTPPGCYDGPELGSRALAVTSPFTRGADVRLLQLGLSDAGISITADGVYGSGSETAVKQYQAAHGLASTNMADQNLIMRIAGTA